MFLPLSFLYLFWCHGRTVESQLPILQETSAVIKTWNKPNWLLIYAKSIEGCETKTFAFIKIQPRLSKITHVKYKLSDLSTKNTSGHGLICIRFVSDFLWVWCEYFVCPIRKRSGVQPPLPPPKKKKIFGLFSAVVKNVAALTCVAGGFALWSDERWSRDRYGTEDSLVFPLAALLLIT